MEADSEPRGPDDSTRPEPFESIDSKLNIFALANGLDLFKDEGAAASRTLEWYRDGMERRIRLVAGDDGTIAVAVEAARKVDGVPHRALASFRDGLEAQVLHESLTGILEEGIERANALERDQLEAGT